MRHCGRWSRFFSNPKLNMKKNILLFLVLYLIINTVSIGQKQSITNLGMAYTLETNVGFDSLLQMYQGVKESAENEYNESEEKFLPMIHQLIFLEERIFGNC